MKSIKKIGLVVALLLFTNGLCFSQDRPTHELHSMMIYNFLKYVQWPGDLNSGDFVIGVIGDDDVYKTLNTWYGSKSRGDKNLIVKKFNSPGEISGCQLLYVGSQASRQFDDILNKLQGESTLTVSGESGLGKKGSCINFKVVNNRLKFELNQASVDANNLKVSSQLTAMAILL